jgi:thiamine pyrophosphate-dependent acetolactate synthase large subunit-like protein
MPDGTVSMLAGSESAGFADVAGASAQFHDLVGVAVDGEGSIIITNTSNHRVRKVAPDGTVSTLTGSGRLGFADGAGAAAQFNNPFGVAVDGEGIIIISDQGNQRVRKITPDGTVSTLTGSGSAGFADGAGATAQFNHPLGVAVDGEGSIIIADWDTAAQFNRPRGVAVDDEGSIIITDYNNKRVGKITPNDTVSTLFAGSCVFRGVVIDSDGCVVVGTGEHTVAKIADCRVAGPRYGTARWVTLANVTEGTPK